MTSEPRYIGFEPDRAGDVVATMEAILTASLVRRSSFSDDRVLAPGGEEYLREEICRGIVVASPLGSFLGLW